MREAEDKNRVVKRKKAARLLAMAAVSVLGLILLVAIALMIYLATAHPANQLSRYLTSYLQQGFTVDKIQLSGRTLILKKVRLENPAGFPKGDLFAADVVAIAPRWYDLLRHRQRFQLISIEGGKLNLAKNSSGTWNFSGLQQRLAKRPEEAPAPETLIRKLLVKNGAITVQGQGVQGINLQVFDLTTGGSRDAQIELAFDDAARNRYLLKGTARPGADAAVDLSLTAASLSLKHLATLLKLKNARALEHAQGALKANAVLVKGELRSSGLFTFSKVLLPGAQGDLPIAGALRFNADYNMSNDTANLSDTTLTIDRMAQVQAKGSVSGVRKEREFALLIGLDQFDLALLNALMPAESRGNLLFAGRLRCESLRLEGRGGTGLESASGSLQLQDGSLSRRGELVVAGLAGRASLSGKGGAVAVTGKLTTPRTDQKAQVEALDLPFDLTLSPQMKPLRARTDALSARLMGVPVAGRIAFDAAKGDPISASLKVPSTRLTKLNPLLRRYDLQAASGTTSGTLDLTGKNAQDLKALAQLQLSNFTGKRGKDSLAVKNGAVTAKVRKQGENLQAQGNAKLSDLGFNGKTGDARFAYRFADRMIHLEGAQFELAATKFSVSRLSARIPATEPSAKGAAPYPLLLDLEGGSVKQGDIELGNLSGRVRGNLVREGSEKWLEGSADLSSKSVSWQRSGVAAPVLHATFSRSGGRAELGGVLLGGKLTGQALFKPFAPQAGATFQIGVTGALMAQAAGLLPKSKGMRPTEGLIDLRLSGEYSDKGGFSSHFESKGSGISLADASGKSLLSGAALSLAGRFSGGTLFISEAILSPGEKVALRMKGDIARALSPKRHGTLAFSLAETPLNGVVDSLINMMPRMVQEATLDGTVAASGKLELREERQLLDGGVSIKGGRVASAPQKLVVADINGRVPFSLDLSGKGGGRPRGGREFSRQNYQRVLAQLRDTPPGGEVITVGKIVFGTLEMGKLTMQARAANGLIELASLRTTLYEGAILGTGYLTMGEKLAYRGDILVNGLSMRTLCNSLPNLEGYISGRVDGIISLSGAGGGIKDITGFVDLWAREGAGEKMLVSKEFLQRLAKQKLSGFFLTADRRYDQAEIKATLEEGDLTFNSLKIVNTNLFRVRDLNVSIAPTQNRIALDHLLESIKEAAVRGKPATGDQPAAKGPEKKEIAPEFKWQD